MSSVGIMLVFLTMFGFFFVVSQLFQLVLGLRPVRVRPADAADHADADVVHAVSAVAVSRVGVRRVVIPGMLTTAVGVLMLSLLHADSGYLAVLVGMVVMALGMGLTMTPMTTMIMSSVPPDKAGIGSAMNDTTREVGTTLGVAVLGSILSSGYASHIVDAANALPDDARHATESSLAGARVVSEQIGGSAGAALFDAAKEAWVHGLQLSLTVGAGIILAAALLTWKLLPAQPITASSSDEHDRRRSALGPRGRAQPGRLTVRRTRRRSARAAAAGLARGTS